MCGENRLATSASRINRALGNPPSVHIADRCPQIDNAPFPVGGYGETMVRIVTVAPFRWVVRAPLADDAGVRRKMDGIAVSSERIATAGAGVSEVGQLLMREIS